MFSILIAGVVPIVSAFDAEKALTSSCKYEPNSRDQEVGKWIVAKVAQLTFPLHFSWLILNSLQTFYSCLSVCYISLRWVVCIKMPWLNLILFLNFF